MEVPLKDFRENALEREMGSKQFEGECGSSILMNLFKFSTKLEM